jgi:hypothetical protein
LLFQFIGNDVIAFGSDGKQHQDEDGRSYVEIDHFYPPAHPAWKIPRNRMLGAERSLTFVERRITTPRKQPPSVSAVPISIDHSAQVALDGNAIYWTESQPQKQGRSFVYCAIEGGAPELVTPDDENHFNVRTRLHEYGGGSFVVEGGIVYFSNFADQRLYEQNTGRHPRPITPPQTGALRYADGVVDRRRGRIICVREDHTVPGKVINTLVGVDVAGGAKHQILASSNDFYSTPRLSPDGNRLAWLTWNHPNMSWVATEAWVGELEDNGMLRNARRVAGGADEALFQPEWSPDGDLYLVSDRGKGWWNLYRERAGALEPMAPREAEFGRPQWTFGMSTYAFESPERLICCFLEGGKWNLAALDTRTKRFDPIPTRFTDVSQLRASLGRASASTTICPLPLCATIRPMNGACVARSNCWRPGWKR